MSVRRCYKTLFNSLGLSVNARRSGGSGFLTFPQLHPPAIFNNYLPERYLILLLISKTRRSMTFSNSAISWRLMGSLLCIL